MKIYKKMLMFVKLFKNYTRNSSLQHICGRILVFLTSSENLRNLTIFCYEQ